jgi:hypothetical protein
VRKAVEFAVENSLLMVLGALIALIWANTTPQRYDAVVHPLHFAVNDVGMVFFFGLAVKESSAGRYTPAAWRARQRRGTAAGAPVVFV